MDHWQRNLGEIPQLGSDFFQRKPARAATRTRTSETPSLAKENPMMISKLARWTLAFALFGLGCGTDDLVPRSPDVDAGSGDGDQSGNGDGDQPGHGDGDQPGNGDGDQPGHGDGDQGGDGDAPMQGDGDQGGDGDAGGDGDVSGTPPDIEEQFTSLDDWSQNINSPEGGISIQEDARADDHSLASFVFPGNPQFGANDNTSPGYANELVLNDHSFHYGKFETRVRFSSCSNGEEVVDGIFTYAHGGDQNNNGITDNSEIDIEYLCGTPEILWLTVYTDYDDFVQGGLRKLTRQVDMRTGKYTLLTDFPPEETESGTIDGLALPNFPGDTFYRVGFEWRATFVRYYIVLDGKEVDLFTIDQADRIPIEPAEFLINIWHTPEHWDGSGTADYPANDALMLLDWVKIWN
jgi:hypothetical protein